MWPGFLKHEYHEAKVARSFAHVKHTTIQNMIFMHMYSLQILKIILFPPHINDIQLLKQQFKYCGDPKTHLCQWMFLRTWVTKIKRSPGIISSAKHTLKWQSSSKNRWEQKRATSQSFCYSTNQLLATLLSSLP
jgi:hypothetical protein